MDDQLTARPGRRAPDVAPPPPAVPAPRTPARQPLVPRPGTATPGGMVLFDDELLERTLRFSGSFVSDDGHVRVRRAPGEPAYSPAGFLGYCGTCARAGSTPPAGEPLADVRVVIQFVAAHDHEDVD